MMSAQDHYQQRSTAVKSVIIQCPPPEMQRRQAALQEQAIDVVCHILVNLLERLTVRY